MKQTMQFWVRELIRVFRDNGRLSYLQEDGLYHGENQYGTVF
jgi:hypothetical protein